MIGFEPDASAVRQSRKRDDFAGDPMLKRGRDSAAMLDYWNLTDALVDGIEALKAEGECFLPRFNGEKDAEYTLRLKFTKYTNVYRDIVEGLANKPFQEEVKFAEDDNKTVPAELIELSENIDGSGNNITVFASNTFFNGINSAVDWIFVDAPPRDPSIRNRADEKRAGIRPYWSHVLGRNIIDIQSRIIGGNEVLTYIKIFEPGSPDQVREFKRDDTGVVTWSLYEYRLATRPMDDDTSATHYHLIDDGVVEIGRIPLVPFATGKRDGRSWQFFPVMRAAADLAKDLYQQESGLKWSKTLSAYPMLAGNGVTPIRNAANEIEPVAIGPGKVLYSPPDGQGNSGTWQYISPDPAILAFLAADIEATIKQLREVGRQPLTAQSNLTVINSAAAAGKARSTVKAWALGLKDALENAAVITCLFMNINVETYDPTIYVYTEFDEWAEGKDFETLDADRDRGDISRETLLEEKQRRGVYSPEFTIEREMERLLAEVPSDDALDRNNPDLE